MIRCDACQGKKKLLSLGNIMKDCPFCKAIGWLKEKNPEPQERLSEIMDIPKIKKKPGRKPKEVIIHV